MRRWIVLPASRMCGRCGSECPKDSVVREVSFVEVTRKSIRCARCVPEDGEAPSIEAIRLQASAVVNRDVKAHMLAIGEIAKQFPRQPREVLKRIAQQPRRKPNAWLAKEPSQPEMWDDQPYKTRG